MHEEEFAHGNSAIHRLDPRMKILLTFAFTIVVAVSTRHPVLLTALLGAIALVVAARLDLLLVLKRMIIVNIFILFMWIFLPFTTPGAEILTIGPLAASREGIELALQITLKSNAIVLTGIALLSTTSLISLGHALSHLKVPNKLVQLFFFTVRYSYTIHEEYLKMRNALKVRCFRARTNLHTYRTYGYMLARLLLGSFERSERILSAMKCRGFKKKLPLLDHFHLHSRDVLFAAIFVFFVAILGVFQWTRILL